MEKNYVHLCSGSAKNGWDRKMGYQYLFMKGMKRARMLERNGLNDSFLSKVKT